MVRDPVCGMEVDPKRSDWVAEYNGRYYHFCSEDCQKAFMDNLEDYAEINPMGRSHAGHGGHMGGCCGGLGAGGGWLRYVHVAIMILLVLLLFLGR